MNAFKFGQFVKQAIEPMPSGVVSPNLGMDKAKFIPPPKQNVQLPTRGKYNYETRGGLVTSINGQAVPMNDEQKAYLAKIDDVRRRMDSSNLLADGDANPPAPPTSLPSAQSIFSKSRPASPPASRAATPTQSPQDMLNRQRVQQAYADRAAAMKRQGLNANNPADLAKFKGGWTGPLPPSNSTPPAASATPGDPFEEVTDPFEEVTPAPPPPPAPRPAPVRRPQPKPMARPASYTPPQPNVTTTKVDNTALQQQMKQMQAQPKAPPAPPPPSMASAWANQTNNQPGAISAPMSSVSTAFNNATGQQDPPHIITTDNGRKFNTQTKTFLDGRPGGFAR